MKIEKMPSGSYRVRQQSGGKRYQVYFDTKPTQKEAIERLNELMQQDADVKGTFYQSCKDYVKLKENVLSPRTVREYNAYRERIPKWFTSLKTGAITAEDVQRVINELSVGRAPKTVRCYNGFITAVLGVYRPHLILSTTLPQKVLNEPYIPFEADVKKILEYSKGGRYEIPLKLACYGLRRSEICAVTVDDLTEDDQLILNKALVQNTNKEWVIKVTKTTESTRSIPIDHELAELIRTTRTGRIFDGYPGTITNYLTRTQNKLGMPNFSIHKFRHFFASKLMEIDGVTQKDIQLLGGWKNDETLKRVYQHSMKAKTDAGKKEITSKLTKSLF